MSIKAEMTQSSPFLRRRNNYVPFKVMQLAELAGCGLELPVTEQHKLSELQSETIKKSFKSILKHSGHQAFFSASSQRRVGVASQVSAGNVGVVFSGGPAPGGHNVLWGLYDALGQIRRGAKLYGFLGGPGGILADHVFEMSREHIAAFKNTGGFHLLGTGRTKLNKVEQFARVAEVLEKHGIRDLVIIGGDDSNTNAAFLAEYFLKNAIHVNVVGVPKTIDGDLRNHAVKISFGFDSAVRCYSELISNICYDVLSTKKYYHFIRLMGRSASLICLEAALQTQPTAAIISEEVAAKGMKLFDVVEELVTLIEARAARGKNYGVVLVPEGLVDFIPEIKALISELNQVLHHHEEYVATLRGFSEASEFVNRKLSSDASHLFSSLPIDIQRQLLLERDPHGNVVVSMIETERLLIELVEARLQERKSEGRYKEKFQTQRHFLGYEGRSVAPTNFDADYTYNLGLSAALLLQHELSGFMAAVHGLDGSRSDWQLSGVPLIDLMTVETRKARAEIVVKKALVDLEGVAFKRFCKQRIDLMNEDLFCYTGPIQYEDQHPLMDAYDGPQCIRC